MKNISKCKGQKIIDKYRDGAEKLYVLCDHINKKAMTWYVLKIEFSADEVELIKRLQQTMEDMKALQKIIAKDEDVYEVLDIGYLILMECCEKCKGNVKVVKFFTNGKGNEFNIYKCENCGLETRELHPNQIKQIKPHFKTIYNQLQRSLTSKTLLTKERRSLRYQVELLNEMEDEVLTSYEEVTNTITAIKESVLAEIETNGETYKEYLKYKYHFDR